MWSTHKQMIQRDKKTAKGRVLDIFSFQGRLVQFFIFIFYLFNFPFFNWYKVEHLL
ncbi:hypothetical protein ACE6H2_019849 [Prunus campanulata]